MPKRKLKVLLESSEQIKKKEKFSLRKNEVIYQGIVFRLNSEIKIPTIIIKDQEHPRVGFRWYSKDDKRWEKSITENPVWHIEGNLYRLECPRDQSYKGTLHEIAHIMAENEGYSNKEYDPNKKRDPWGGKGMEGIELEISRK